MHEYLSVCEIDSLKTFLEISVYWIIRFNECFSFFFYIANVYVKINVREIDKRDNRDCIESHKSKMISGTPWLV